METCRGEKTERLTMLTEINMVMHNRERTMNYGNNMGRGRKKGKRQATVEGVYSDFCECTHEGQLIRLDKY